MATTIQGEIRIGPNHQARVPPVINGQCDEPTRETLLWKPDRLADTDLLMFLRAARSMAAFAGMCDGGSSEDGFLAASRDQTTTTAMEALHQSSYDTERALHDLVKKPIGHTIEKTWTEDDIKKFVRGLKQHGKNFFRIRRDLLSHKETCDLVEFYYLWKKSPAAVTHRPRQRPRRGQMLRRKAGNAKTARATPSENSSTTDSDSGCEDSDDNSNLSGPCRHCEASVAKEWHRVDKEGTVLCTDCKLHFDEARNDVIRANDPNSVVEAKPPSLPAESSIEQPMPAKRSKLESDSPTSHAPPALLPALVTTPTSTSVVILEDSGSKSTTQQSDVQQTTLPPSVPAIRSPTVTGTLPTYIDDSVTPTSANKEVTKHAEKEDEAVDAEGSSSMVQDDLLHMLSTGGGKAMEPKVDDTECHRSSNAIFRRHWNRGDNSCARTDLVYVPVPRPNASLRTHEVSITKEKSPVHAPATSETRQVSSGGGGGSGAAAAGPVGPVLDSSMPALQRLRDYASAATGSFSGNASADTVDPRLKHGLDGMPGGRASPQVVQQPPPLQYATPGPGLIQRAPGPAASLPPYDLMPGPQQFDVMAAERWLLAEQQRMQWERAMSINPAAANDMAARLQLERMMAGSIPLTHTHAHTHLHIHAARAAAAMQQNTMLAGFPPGAAAAWAAATGRPSAASTLDAFNASNLLYGGPPAPPSFPPPAFMPPPVLDSVTAERLAQQQHILELFHQRQLMSDRE